MLLLLPALGQSQVRVLALFPGKAMLDIDGQRKVLSKGQQVGAVELLEASPREARVRVDGRVETLRLGNAVGTHFAPRVKEELRLLRNGESFFADGLINGQPVRMLVDTGATTVALSEVKARQLGIPYVLDGKGAMVSTASGTSPAYRVKLDSLKLGTQTFHGIQALVVQGDSPPFVLLGMNVLRRFDVDHRGNLMILRAKH
jgi:aspartyl protease family protein